MKLFYFEKRLFGTSLYLLLKDQTYEKGQNSLGHALHNCAFCISFRKCASL